jgi:hypothetical protein
MSILLVATDKIDSLDNAGLFYAKPLNDRETMLKIKDYILHCGLHSGLNYEEEISELTAGNIANGIIELLKTEA